MEIATALKLLRDFSKCHPRIFRQFSGFPTSCGNEGGYVVFVDMAILNEPCYNSLKDFVEESNLCLSSFENYLMVSG